jgi:hypothetical protein
VGASAGASRLSYGDPLCGTHTSPVAISHRDSKCRTFCCAIQEAESVPNFYSLGSSFNRTLQKTHTRPECPAISVPYNPAQPQTLSFANRGTNCAALKEANKIPDCEPNPCPYEAPVYASNKDSNRNLSAHAEADPNQSYKCADPATDSSPRHKSSD